MSRFKRPSRLSEAELTLAQDLTARFNKGAPLTALAASTTLTQARIRTLMLEAARHAARTAPATKEDSTKKSTPDEVEQAVSDGVQRAINELFDSATLKDLVQEVVAKYPPQTGELKVTISDSTKSITVKHSHAMLKEALRRVSAGFQNLLIVGPAGSGKTTLAEQLAKCLKRSFGFLSLSGGTTEGQLLGRLTPAGKYLPSKFVDTYENGGVFLLDEVDAADANVLLVLNSALANGQLSVPARVENPVAVRHESFVLVAAANTWGTGADWQYVGRNQLDAAFLSRFAGCVLEVNYDAALERALTVQSWYDSFMVVRSSATSNRLRRILGTRELLAGQKLLKAGYTDKEVWTALTAGWTPDERMKARVIV